MVDHYRQEDFKRKNCKTVLLYSIVEIFYMTDCLDLFIGTLFE